MERSLANLARFDRWKIGYTLRNRSEINLIWTCTIQYLYECAGPAYYNPIKNYNVTYAELIYIHDEIATWTENKMNVDNEWVKSRRQRKQEIIILVC